jgi:colanic acid biosynthesis glycosyl transferase WcaI
MTAAPIMHLVFLNQYYPPDAAPTGVMLAAVVEELAAQGHKVTVICAEGGYAGTRQKTSRQKTEDEESHAIL